jgi:AmiR/NasT family two-component response regulator
MALRTLYHENKVVLILDYQGCREQEMINLVIQAKERIKELNKPVIILSVYNQKNYITPKFMKVVEEQSTELINLIDKQAVVGLTAVKKMILKGYNFLLKRNIQNFDTEQEALDFLLNPETTDKDFKTY